MRCPDALAHGLSSDGRTTSPNGSQDGRGFQRRPLTRLEANVCNSELMSESREPCSTEGRVIVYPRLLVNRAPSPRQFCPLPIISTCSQSLAVFLAGDGVDDLEVL